MELVPHVRQGVVGEVLLEVGVRLGLRVPLFHAPADVVGRAVRRHPKPERGTLGAERLAELIQVLHACGEGAGRGLPHRFAVLPAVVRHHAVDLDARALERLGELAVNGGQVIPLQVLARRVEPVVVVRVAPGAALRPAVVDDRLFRSQATRDGEDSDKGRTRVRGKRCEGGRETQRAHETRLGLGLQLRLLEVDETMVADLLEAVRVGRGLVAVRMPRQGRGFDRHQDPCIVKDDRLATSATSDLGLGAEPLRFDRDLLVGFVFRPGNVHRFENGVGRDAPGLLGQYA